MSMWLLMNKGISPLPVSQPPLCPLPAFPEPDPARQRVMDCLCMSLEGCTDYKAAMCRELHDDMGRLREKCSVSG